MLNTANIKPGKWRFSETYFYFNVNLKCKTSYEID